MYARYALSEHVAVSSLEHSYILCRSLQFGTMEGGALEPWITQMGKQDIRLKLKIGEDLLAWVDNENNSLQGEDVGALIDGLVSW